VADEMIQIGETVTEAKDILTNQIFSQQMMESLINDLLDLGKLQKNVFKL